MTLRWLCLLTLMIFAAPLFADEQATEPDAPPPSPAAANATVQVAPPEVTPTPEVTPPPEAQAAPATPPTEQTTEPDKVTPTILTQRVDALLKDPGPLIDRAAVQSQLDDLTFNAYELSNVAADPQVRFDALNLQLQSLYTRLVEYPDAADVDQQLGRLRAAARRIKAIELPSAQTTSVGDFWLMTAELYDMNRTKLPLDARRKQAAALMKDFLAKHPDWPAAMDVREAMGQLESAAPSPSQP